jgi:hypothetical protein
VSDPVAILVARCGTCHGRFLPRPGPCPYCGSREVTPEPVPPEGRVLAATELASPMAGGPAVHRLALVELAQSVRILALVDGPLPLIDSVVAIHRDGAVYRVGSIDPSALEGAGRGEGDVPAAGGSRPPFEPPR